MNPALLVRRSLKRLRSMNGSELRFRSSTMLRTATDRAAFALHKPIWQRSAYLSLARLAGSGDADIDRSVEFAGRGDWRAAHASVLRFVADGRSGFVLDPRRRIDITAGIQSAFPTAVSDAVERAERILAGTFDLLGYKGLSFAGDGGPIDWQYDPVHNRRPPRVFWDRVPYLAPECGDHKIIWELNRHQHWMALGRAYWLTGDARFRECFIDQLRGWLAANPPLEGINWASMLELSLRSLSWIWALHFFAPTSDAEKATEAPWAIDLLVAIDRQLTLVERNLSRYFSPNTHLLGEGLALYVAGRTLPLRNAERWAAVGRSVLIDEIGRQINRDGGHVELSTHYHRYTLDFYLLALAIARTTDDPAAAMLSSAVSRLATFARAMADDRGRLPAIGDEDGGSLLPFCGRPPADAADSLQIAAGMVARPELAVGPPAEEVVWMTGRLPATQTPVESWPSTALTDSGYYISRFAGGDQLTIDAGPHGFLNGGHAHADALSIALTVGARPLIVDPGTACYTVDPEMRDRFRSTAFHNTLTLDRRSQSVPDGPFHWRSTARAVALDWRTANALDYFEGEHDGYAPSIHRRAVSSRPGCWIVVDRISADPSTGHRADVHWHVDPAWTVTQVGRQSARVAHDDGAIVWMVGLGDSVTFDVLRGSAEQRDLGWCSPAYGKLVSASTIRLATQGTTPIHLATAIVASPEAPVAELILPANPQEPVRVRICTPSWSDTIAFFAPDH